MAERKPFTPEEQLLKLIENPQSGDKTKGGGKKKGGKISFPGFGKLLGAFSFAKGGRAKAAVAAPGLSVAVFDLKWVNRALVALILATIIYLVLDVLFLKPSQADFLAQVGTNDPVYPIMNKDFKSDLRELHQYQKPVKRRNPFLAPGVATEVQPEDDVISIPAVQSARMVDLLKGLKLVGISTGKEPLAMIEDENSGRTYFLKSGQELRTMKIQTITAEKVIVTYEGEQAELF